MWGYVARRLGAGILVVGLVSLAVFALFFLAPHDVARRMAGPHPDPAAEAAVASRLHLDDPAWRQYLSFVGGALRGDLGYDYYHHVPVTRVITDAAPVTLSLALGAAVVWTALGMAGGVLSAVRPRSASGRTLSILTVTCYAVPSFAVGLGLLYLLSFRPTLAGLPALPGGGYVPLRDGALEWARHLVLPWLALSLMSAATYSRLTRNALLDVLSENHIRAARAKGLRPWRIVLAHGLRPAAAPAVTQLGIDVGWLLGGAVVVETVFSLPGLGWVSVQAVNDQNLPVILGTVLVGSVTVVLANLVTDLAHAVLDPRVRLTG